MLKPGTKIRLKESEEPFFYAGDMAVLTDEPLLSGCWWADFNNQGNSIVYKDGIWCVGTPSDFEVIE
jgi:hypothetical protein